MQNACGLIREVVSHQGAPIMWSYKRGGLSPGIMWFHILSGLCSGGGGVAQERGHFRNT